MKLSPELIKMLERDRDNYRIWYEDYRTGKNIENPEYANYLCVGIWESKFIARCFHAPKNKVIDYDWIFSKVGEESHYLNLSKIIRDRLNFNSYSCYPTSYGIGIDLFFGLMDKSASEQAVRQFLDNNSIAYTCEYSDAGWVYRFKISKAKENIENLKSLIAKEAIQIKTKGENNDRRRVFCSKFNKPALENH